jgi:hypothetical protein
MDAKTLATASGMAAIPMPIRTILIAITIATATPPARTAVATLATRPSPIATPRLMSAIHGAVFGIPTVLRAAILTSVPRSPESALPALPTRRDVLLGGLALTVGVASAHADWSPTQDASPEEVLTAILDVILPEGAHPGYQATDLVSRLGTMLRIGSRLSPLFAMLFKELEASARQKGSDSFIALNLTDREVVLHTLEVRRYPPFQFVLEGAMRLHYSHPKVWKDLGFSHPPQPTGFLDHMNPPPEGKTQ